MILLGTLRGCGRANGPGTDFCSLVQQALANMPGPQGPASPTLETVTAAHGRTAALAQTGGLTGKAAELTGPRFQLGGLLGSKAATPE